MSKILANKLKKAISKIISPFQGVLIQGRDIYDNILVAHKILNSFLKKKINMDLLQLNQTLKKAYDRVEWNLFGNALQKLAFRINGQTG